MVWCLRVSHWGNPQCFYWGEIGMGFSGGKQEAFHLPWNGWDVSRSYMKQQDEYEAGVCTWCPD